MYIVDLDVDLEVVILHDILTLVIAIFLLWGGRGFKFKGKVNKCGDFVRNSWHRKPLKHEYHEPLA